MANTFYETMNLLVPAFGNTRCLAQVFPLAPDNVLDFNGVTLDDIPFLPQSVTVDATSVPDGESAIFEVLQIGFRRFILGGSTATFNFPAIRNLRIKVTTTDSVSTVRCFFYNYPAFVDREGALQATLANSSVSVNSLPPVVVASTPPPFGIPQLSVIRELTGATGTGALITPTGSQSVEIYSINVSVNAQALVNTFLRIRANLNSILSIPVTVSNAPFATVLNFPVPIRLPMGQAVDINWGPNTTLTGGVGVSIFYNFV